MIIAEKTAKNLSGILFAAPSKAVAAGIACNLLCRYFRVFTGCSFFI